MCTRAHKIVCQNSHVFKFPKKNFRSAFLPFQTAFQENSRNFLKGAIWADTRVDPPSTLPHNGLKVSPEVYTWVGQPGYSYQKPKNAFITGKSMQNQCCDLSFLVAVSVSSTLLKQTGPNQSGLLLLIRRSARLWGSQWCVEFV